MSTSIGDIHGIWQIVRIAEPDAHSGIRAEVKCVKCGKTEIKVVAKIRYSKPQVHRGCGG
jgi:hypothetical protein